MQCCSFVSLYGKNAWLFVHVRVGRVCPLFFCVGRLIFFQVLGDKFFFNSFKVSESESEYVQMRAGHNRLALIMLGKNYKQEGFHIYI